MNVRSYYSHRWETEGYSVEDPYRAHLFEYIKKNFVFSGKRILDLGCGIGEFGALFSGNNDVFGVDFSEYALKQGRARGMNCLISNLDDNLPFKNEQFDFVIATDILEHLFDPFLFLREVSRVLKPGGGFFCSTPNAGIIANRLYFLLTGEFRDFTYRGYLFNKGLPFNEHLRIFSPKLLRHLLDKCNFVVRKFDHWFPDKFMTPSLKKLSWVAGLVHLTRGYRIFPSLFSAHMCVYAIKRRIARPT